MLSQIVAPRSRGASVPVTRLWGGLMRVVVVLALAVSLILAGPALPNSPSVAAQEIPEMPALGTVVLENPLTSPGPLRLRSCPTDRNSSAFVEGGLEMKVTGRCTETSTGAATSAWLPGFTAANGELSIEVKLVEGFDRGWLAIGFREQNNGDAYTLYLVPSRRRIELQKLVGSISALIAERADTDLPEPDAWVRIGVRLEGQRIWVLLNDQPVMSATDPTLARGGFWLATGRLGNVEDDAPVTAIWRNLRVTALASEPPPSASNQRPRPTGDPPAVGRVIHEESLTEQGVIPSGTCRTGKGRGEVVGEGFLIAVRGRCTDADSGASAGPILRGLNVPDGEVRFEFKVVGGFERSSVALFIRRTGEPFGTYGFFIAPGRGAAALSKYAGGRESTLLTQRSGLGDLLRRDDWNVMSVRVVGSSLWLVVNDQPVLSAEDGDHQGREVGLTVGRLGNVDDDEEVAIVFRNFRLTAIEGAPDDRAPSYVRPPQRPNEPGSVLSLAPWTLGARNLDAASALFAIR